MAVAQAQARITAAVTGWHGVTAHPHRFGGIEYRLGERRELGHVHGDHLVDIPLPMRLRDEVVTAGRAQPHHGLPDSGWISLYLRAEADVETAIQLLRLSYEVAQRQRGDTPPLP